MKVIFGRFANYLEENVKKYIDVENLNINISNFSDGEIYVEGKDNIFNKEVLFIQTFPRYKVNEALVEAFIILDALRRGNPKKIYLVLPYFPYARQDRKINELDPISASLVAKLFETSGADVVITLDLHAPQIAGNFKIPCFEVSALNTFANYFKNKVKDDFVVVAPDAGAAKRARKFSKLLGDLPVVIIDKYRPKPNVSEVAAIFGDIEDKNCILIDDMIDTAGTITNAAKFLKEKGAKDIYICATHGVFSGKAKERIEGVLKENVVKEVVVTNSLPQEIKGLTVLDIMGELLKFFK